jgi:hypothetical protein
MPFTDSTRHMVTGVLADTNEPADYPTQIANIVNAIEPRLVLTATNVGAATSLLTPLVEPMLLVTTQAPKEVYIRLDGAWKKIWPMAYTGPGAPASTLGASGDFYFQTA